jgi:beta propeller repeat protein
MMNARTQQTMVVILSLMVVGQVALGAKQEVVISTAAGDQQVPAVSGSVVVWEDKQTGAWDIGYRDLSANPLVTRQLGTTGEDRNPAIWGKTIVWQAKQPLFLDWDIRLGDITNPSSPVQRWIDQGIGDQAFPRIWENYVAYQDNFLGDWDITVMDISDPAHAVLACLLGSYYDEQSPAIWGNLVLYQSDAFGDWDLWGADVRDPNSHSILTPYDTDQQHPAVQGNWAAWQADSSGDWDIFADFIADPLNVSMPVCARQGSHAQYPAIWNNIVVWQDNRNGNWDIYGFNLTGKTEFRITDNGSDQMYPAISFSRELSKYVVVWQDKRNGNWDIYGALIDGPEVAGCASPLRWDVNADCVVDNSDVTEVQQNVGQRDGISP